MSVRYTDKPSEALPGETVGKPVRLPYFMLCTAAGDGQKLCGWVRTANTMEQFVTYAAERRAHEMGCLGGLVVVGE